MMLPPTVGQLSVGSFTRSAAEKFGACAMSAADWALVEPAAALTVTVRTATAFVAYLPMIQPTKPPRKIRATTSVITTASAVYTLGPRRRLVAITGLYTDLTLLTPCVGTS